MSDELLVKVWRDKQVFEAKLEELAARKAALDAVFGDRAKLAIEAGLQEAGMASDATHDDQSRPDDFYPSFDRGIAAEKKALAILCSSMNHEEKWPSKLCSTKTVLPEAVIEELAIARRYRFFESIIGVHNKNSHQEFLFVGIRGNIRYPIVYWGRKSVYDEFDNGIKALEAAIMHAPAGADQPAHQPPYGPGRIAHWVAFAVMVTCIAIAAITAYNAFSDGTPAASPQAISTQPVSVKPKTCWLAQHPGWNVIDSVDKLFGTVSHMESISCGLGHAHYIVNVRGRDSNPGFPVTAEVFRQLKVGDQLPPAKPKARSEEF